MGTRKKLNRKKLKKAFLFFFCLLLFSIPFRYIYSHEYFVDFLIKYVVEDLVLVFRSLGVKTSVGYPEYGMPLISLPWIDVEIIRACTGWRSMFFFVALCFSVPEIELKRKIYSFFYLPFIYLLNILRLVLTIITARFVPVLTDFAHNILWRDGLLFSVLFLFYLWLWNEKRRQKKK